MNRRLIIIAACVGTAGPAAWADGAQPDMQFAAQILPAKTLLAQAAPEPAPAPAPTPAQGQPPAPPTPQQRVEMLKQWLQMSQAQIRAYEWIETTVITQGGEEKMRRQNQCYYGADGNLQKVQVSQTAAAQGGPPGILPFGKIAKKAAANKKEEVTEYMKSAAALVHSYIPPDPARIQQSAAAGKVAVNMLQPGRLVRLDIRDYLKPGDVLGIEVELPTNRLVRMTVATYVDTPKDAVGLNVNMGVLPDGTIYPMQSVLDAKSKGVRVDVQNTGHRRTAR